MQSTRRIASVHIKIDNVIVTYSRHLINYLLHFDNQKIYFMNGLSLLLFSTNIKFYWQGARPIDCNEPLFKKTEYQYLHYSNSNSYE